jgi:hypothetical protein
MLYGFWLCLPGLILCGGMRRRAAGYLVPLLVGIVFLLLLIACGGGLQGGGTAAANPGTPAGSYNMTVTAAMNSAAGSPSKTADVTLTVN